MNSKLYNLFISSQRKLYRFALSLTKDVTDAEDILQDTLLKLWKLRDDWESWENFEAYAMRMIRNEYLNYVKNRKVERIVRWKTFLNLQNLVRRK
jgi:RNA polymerase sigma factor (sigma-70 family)